MNDFTPNKDKPLWPLSSFGPAKGVATLVGSYDESPEELRVKAVQALKAGTTAEYVRCVCGGLTNFIYSCFVL